MSKNPSLKTTKDGSHTLYSERFGQHFHNPNGAVAESKHNFFEQNGLAQALRERKKINILEVGFGTGLNLLLLMDYLQKCASGVSVNYHSIEAFPISPGMASALNYAEYLNDPRLAKKIPTFFKTSTPGMNLFEPINKLKFSLFVGLFEDYQPADIRFDYIFHDAFSPDVNPELWTGRVFKKLHNLSTGNAVLSTYCAASKAKGAMTWAAWKVAKAKGALGKREMTIASPSAEPLAHLKRANEARLRKRYEDGDF